MDGVYCVIFTIKLRRPLVKSISEIVKDRSVIPLIEWDLHPFEAVGRYLEWGSNWSRGLDHAKACNEESIYFKINATKVPAKLLMVRQSHKDYEILAEVEAPQPLIDDSVKQFACRNAACGISDELKAWLKLQVEQAV
jgi:hypothetical protein